MVVLKGKQEFERGQLLVALENIKSMYNNIIHVNTYIKVDHVYSFYDGIRFWRNTKATDEISNKNLVESFRQAYKNERKLCSRLPR